MISPLNPMETTMMYKTICLELLEQRPELYDQLRKRRTLLTTLNRLASELKARHQVWKQELKATRLGSDSQIASEAMELAVKELEDRLSADSEAEAQAFLDAVMATLRPTPPA
jgi:glutamate-1-semialdehyde aminotransferase